MNDFVERYCRFTEIVNSFSDIAEPCATDLLNEHGLTESGSDLAKTVEYLKTEGRSLNIGIIGRVKAGKSSLLNSLFFGVEIELFVNGLLCTRYIPEINPL